MAVEDHQDLGGADIGAGGNDVSCIQSRPLICPPQCRPTWFDCAKGREPKKRGAGQPGRQHLALHSMKTMTARLPITASRPISSPPAGQDYASGRSSVMARDNFSFSFLIRRMSGAAGRRW